MQFKTMERVLKQSFRISFFSNENKLFFPVLFLEICYLYTSQICEASSGQQYTPCQEEDMQFTGKNMTTGSVCFDYASDPIGVEGDPHYTGADGSRFDFTGKNC